MNEVKMTLCLQAIVDLAIKMIQAKMNTQFGLIFCLIQLVLILPVATATIERVFSVLKIVKTGVR